MTGVDGPYSRALGQFFEGWRLKYAALNFTEIPAAALPVILHLALVERIPLKEPVSVATNPRATAQNQKQPVGAA